jgi:hypothetical protein
MRRAPLVVLGYFGASLLTASLFLLGARAILSDWVANRPPLDLVSWLLLARTQPQLLPRLGALVGAALVLHVFLGSLLAGVALERLRGGSTRRGARRFPAILALRSVCGAGVVVVGACWWIAGRLLLDLALPLPHELAPLLVELAAAPLFALPLAVLALLGLLGPCLVVERGAGAFAALRLALGLLHERRRASLGLLVLVLLLVGATVPLGYPFLAPTPLLGQGAVFARCAVSVYALALGLGFARE